MERLLRPKAPASGAKEESVLRNALISMLYSNYWSHTFFSISIFLLGKSIKEKKERQDIYKLHTPYMFCTSVIILSYKQSVTSNWRYQHCGYEGYSYTYMMFTPTIFPYTQQFHLPNILKPKWKKPSIVTVTGNYERGSWSFAQKSVC